MSAILDEARNRDELFDSSSSITPVLRRRRGGGSSRAPGSSPCGAAAAADDSAAITESLLRTRAMLSSEVDRVGAAKMTLEEDAKVMSRTAEVREGFGGGGGKGGIGGMQLA